MTPPQSTESSSAVVPAHTQILVIGAGPAGSYAATVLAREGFDVTILEASKFPRYHIGESMLPSIRHFFRFINAEDKLVKHGFTIKPGAAAKFNQFKREGYTDFLAIGPNNYSWNVIRSEFDNILKNLAQENGASVHMERKVTSLDFSDDRPVKAAYTNPDGTTSNISFEYLVDASGRTGIMSNKYLHNRHMNSSLQNIACWGYWTGAKMYQPGTSRENAPFFEALTDESGWGWFIPLHDGTTSVGIVMDMPTATRKKRRVRTLREHYVDQLDLVPNLKALLEGASLQVDHPDHPPIQSASDFSYQASKYAGDHWRLAGDASAFIDPFFSSGVHLALAGGFTAAISIAASIRGHCSELDAAQYHDRKVMKAYTRFMLVVLGAYKQIRAQTSSVLSDITEDNFDRAFDLIRPIIQGTADADAKVSEAEVQKTMDFVTHVLVTPINPEMMQSVSERIPQEMLAMDGKYLLEEDIARVVQDDDDDAKHVLRAVNARKEMHDIYDGPLALAAVVTEGFVAILEKGRLGLTRVQTI